MDCNNQQDSPAIFTDGKGQYIERLSEQHDTVSFSPQGGGPVYELPRATFYERYHIAAPAQFKWVKVRGDWMDEAAAIAAAWHQLRWNGWVMPYFRFEDVKQLCELVPNLTYDEAADAVWLRVPEEERGGYYDDECYPATLIEVDGQQVKAYSVGAGSWCWEIAD